MLIKAPRSCGNGIAVMSADAEIILAEPAFDIGKEPAHILFQLPDNKKAVPENKIIASTLVERGSTTMQPEK
ncbi:MAG: hypothetical protein ABI813_11800 [Bacteroidota bacterium]